MSDHKTEAENSLGCAGDIPFGDGDFERRERYYLAAAQVHATLYAAEQQRIANIIALAHTDQDETARGALWEEVGEVFSARYVLRDSIAESLGLS